ncbi:MAG: DUF362 domain-containing protein [candidate division WOR-3 bacterium]|nr:MAG: DUF362 domain-containing protein [candidate division WOR-3 bacterium]
MKDISRRDFLKYVGAGAVGLMARPGLPLLGGDRLDPSTVVQCHDAGATTGPDINEPVVQVMMDESIKALTGENSVGAAWKSVFPGITTDSVIGIKVNCINRYLATHPKFVNTIVSGLAQMNISGSDFPKNNIIVWDRTDYELTSSGYTIYDGNDPDTERCFGTNHSGIGYDSSNPLNVAGVTSNPSKIISQICEFIIDAGVLRTHVQGGVTLCLKNNYGSVHNPGSLSHISHCTPSVPALNAQIRDVLSPTDKQKLFVVDGMFGMYSGGPGGQPNFNPKLLVMSKDIVACDAQGQNVINAERQNRGLQPVNCRHITMASQPPYELGTTEISLIEINNPTGIRTGHKRVAADAGIRVSPHPVRRSANVAFSLPFAATVSLDLVGSSGQTVARIFGGSLTAGEHRVPMRLNGRVAAGTYVLRLKAGGSSRSRSITVLK